MECLPLRVSLLLLLLQVLVWTRIVGVTHWKLQENSIVPASAAPPSSVGESEAKDDLLWSRVSGEDPEFSVLVKRTSGSVHGAGGGLGAIAGGAAVPGARNCGGQKSCSMRRASLGKESTVGSCSRGEAGSGSGSLSSSTGKCERKTSAPRNPDGSGPM